MTIVDVAKHAGVSTASASKVLRNAYGASEAMREKVRASMEELGYRPHGPARGMRGRTYTIGVLVSDIDNPFFSLLADGVSSVIRAHSYELLLSPAGFTRSGQRNVKDALIDHQMDGLVLVSPLMSSEELEETARDIPLCVVGHHSDSDLFDSVAGDDELGASLVVDHLVELGHERIAFVMNHDGRMDPARPEYHRLAGYRAAMERHGLTDQAAVLDASWSFEGGVTAARLVDELPVQPTAVHAGADIVALAMMNELWRQERFIPEAYSLAGYDNSRTSALGPIRLTTVDQSGRQMGETVGRLLVERIEGRTDSRHELMEPTLMARSTTVAPRGE
ncbi:LacI family transcriptional regulator [Tessaracoccus rhinocerotis]|uniref:LacI family transcriptional regulator n=1 Tax=Tessaracoccus rhinocerotis TaxID=1689449 RepID=A0A553JZQ3_9ACTN|nr:LacI family transcriptional regulator [Tessaracoccus rhinocerotis]